MNTKTIISIDDYLANEVTAEQKSEYHAGEVRMMSGAQPSHNQIAMNIGSAFLVCLKNKGCRVYSSDQLIHIPECDKFIYPDVTVVCENPKYYQREGIGLQALLNPLTVVEVLSPSTELYDRTEKFNCYKTIDTLQEYVLVDSQKPQVEVYRRQTDGWLLKSATNLKDIIDILGCKISLDDIYYLAIDQ